MSQVVNCNERPELLDIMCFGGVYFRVSSYQIGRALIGLHLHLMLIILILSKLELELE